MPDSVPWEFPLTAERDVRADWCEHWVLAHSLPLRRGRLSAIVGSQASDLGIDASVVAADTFFELDRRSLLPGHPFSVSRGRVLRVESESPLLLPYAFMLLLCTLPEFAKNSASKKHYPTAAFEGLVRDAIERWYGGYARVMLREAKARRSISTLADLLGVHQPRIADSSRQDHGVDVVAWRPFSDRNEGVPVILCQCTVSRGKNALVLKSRDVVVNEWADLIAVPTSAFVRAIAVPRLLRSPEPKWWDMTRNADLVLDRSRLIEMLAAGAGELLSSAADYGDMQSAIQEAWRVVPEAA